jgi:hypothetical protein
MSQPHDCCALKVKWIDAIREPQNAPDPKYPDGVDLDLSNGAAATCSTSLPYPAKRCGLYVITCGTCHTHNVVTTAGRRDDPRSVKLVCKLI